MTLLFFPGVYVRIELSLSSLPFCIAYCLGLRFTRPPIRLSLCACCSSSTVTHFRESKVTAKLKKGRGREQAKTERDKDVRREKKYIHRRKKRTQAPRPVVPRDNRRERVRFSSLLCVCVRKSTVFCSCLAFFVVVFTFSLSSVIQRLTVCVRVRVRALPV